MDRNEAMTEKDRKEFKAYLTSCTDRQVVAVWQRETDAKRYNYAALALYEAARRGIDLDELVVEI